MAFSMESAVLSFVEVDNMTYTFTQTYGMTPPIVTATSTENVEIFVDSVTTGQATIRASQKGTFSVYVHVVSVYTG